MSDATRAEARERFARALRLFNEGDNAAALAEFQRASELFPSPVVLYNVALVYAAMGRPVEAVDVLDRLLPGAGSLTPEQLARANATRAAQADRVAAIGVKTNVEGAVIEVDNIEVARAPAAAPIRVASGTHVVAAVLPGYVPVRKVVSVAGRAQAEVSLELAPLQGKLAHLVLKTGLPGAEVLVDGQVAGETPLAGSLTVAPGRHRVELRRTGYVTAGQDVALGDAATGELSVEPEEDPVLAPLDGTLALALRETAAVVILDGRLRGPYARPLHVPGGVHHLRVERAGFFASDRDVVVPAEGTLTVAVELEPTPDTLASFTSGVKVRRTWSWVALAGGAAVTAAGVVTLAVDASDRSSDQKQYSSLTGDLATHGGACNFAKGALPSQCYASINSAADAYNAALARDALGYSLLGVGIVAAATGAVLMLTVDDPHHYDRPVAPQPVATRRVRPVFGGGVGGGWLGLTGTF